MKPLDGILVVALEQAVAAPLCTMRLAEAGARIIKIERAEGDFARDYDHVVHGESAYFVWLNHGKESLVLDIKLESDRALLLRIIECADVFIQNLAPGAAERYGFGSSNLRARNSRLITCDISGYGEDGPCRDMKAYDFLIQCESGLASITGSPDSPGRVGVSVADIACGMNAHGAILQALFTRERTGEGAGIAVSLFDGMADWMTVPLLHFDYDGEAPLRQGLRHPSIAPYGAFKVADGQQVVISIQNEREWARFCVEVLLQAELAVDERFASNSLRTLHRSLLDNYINDVFSALSAGVVLRRLEAAQIAYASLNSVRDLSLHPQLRRTTIETTSGPVELPASPVRWANSQSEIQKTPALGEHSATLRREFATSLPKKA